jgi:hypothetical protein
MNEILKLLESIKFPKRKTRKNISSHSIEGFCLGDVNYRGQKLLEYKTRGPSKYNNLYPELFNRLKLLISSGDPDFEYTTIQINKNILSPPHVDKNNVGLSYIIGLGNYQDGELIIEGNKYDIHNKLLKFDGNKGHWTSSFIGTRYSIIYFTHTFKPPCPSKRNIKIMENGMYIKNKLIINY